MGNTARLRARAISKAGGLDNALANGVIDGIVDVSLSEGLVLGLLRQGVRKYFAIFGHGSTDLGEVLRIYDEEGVTRTVNCRPTVSASTISMGTRPRRAKATTCSRSPKSSRACLARSVR
jgi:3D-(3,5/4)-trihydroxycyclohexane-1,2-dione acylhydrolase (decyclizing)